MRSFSCHGEFSAEDRCGGMRLSRGVVWTDFVDDGNVMYRPIGSAGDYDIWMQGRVLLRRAVVIFAIFCNLHVIRVELILEVLIVVRVVGVVQLVGDRVEQHCQEIAKL